MGYAQPDAHMTRLYQKHAAEFTEHMTAVVKLTTPGGAQDVRIFSLRGAHLLGMFARTERAAESHTPSPSKASTAPANPLLGWCAAGSRGAGTMR